MTTIQQHREVLQDLLVSGIVTSVEAQTIALVRFAKKFGYTPVDGDIRKGFVYSLNSNTQRSKFVSLENMQFKYNWYPDVSEVIVARISLQYNKKLGKVTSQKEYLKFDLSITAQ